MTKVVQCLNCGLDMFLPPNSRKKYCSKKCSKEYNKKTNEEQQVENTTPILG